MEFDEVSDPESSLCPKHNVCCCRTAEQLGDVAKRSIV